MWIKTFLKQLSKAYFKQLPKTLFIIFSLSILYVLSYKIYFINQPEIFKYAEACGDVLYNLSLACIASFVFYYFSIYVREEIAKNKTIWFLYEELEDIINVSRTLYKKMESSQIEDNFNYEKFIVDLSTKFHCNTTGHCTYGNGQTREETYADLYYDTIIDIKTLTTIIYIRAPYIDPKILDALLKIERCEYMRMKPELKLLNLHSKFTEMFCNRYVIFLTLIDSLEKHLASDDGYQKFLEERKQRAH